MVRINVAASHAVNPAGATPVITRAQLWKALELKVREAHKFVPVFTACKVLEEHDNVIEREITVKPMDDRPEVTQKETCKLFKPIKVDFHEANGAVMTNLVSEGPNRTEEELQLTYSFEWLHPDLTEESEEVTKLTKDYEMRAKIAVEKALETIRKWCEEGKF